MWKALLAIDTLLIYPRFRFGIAYTAWVLAVLWNLNLLIWLVHKLVIYPRLWSPLRKLPEPEVFRI